MKQFRKCTLGHFVSVVSKGDSPFQPAIGVKHKSEIFKHRKTNSLNPLPTPINRLVGRNPSDEPQMLRKLITCTILLASSLLALAQEDTDVHCRETLDCPMYPYDACFAESQGLVCHAVR